MPAATWEVHYSDGRPTRRFPGCADAADSVGCTAQFISRWAAGKTKIQPHWGVAKVVKIAPPTKPKPKPSMSRQAWHARRKVAEFDAYVEQVKKEIEPWLRAVEPGERGFETPEELKRLHRQRLNP